MNENIVTQKIVFDSAGARKGLKETEDAVKNTNSEISKENSKMLKEEIALSNAKAKLAREEVKTKKQTIQQRIQAEKSAITESKKFAKEQEKSNLATSLGLAKSGKGAQDLGGSFLSLGNVVKGFFAMSVVNTVGQHLKEIIDIAKQAQISMSAFESVVKAKGISISSAMQIVNDSTKDGMMSVAEAQKSLQNLFARGYDISQAKEVMKTFMDAGAFGKAAHLNFGEAIVTATEGLRQENSVLVDNIGITKNVAKMWEEYAKAKGLNYASLTQEQKIEAEVLGIRQEAAMHLGNYEKMLQSVAGAEAKFNAELLKHKTLIGNQLLPSYEKLLELCTSLLSVSGFIVTSFQKWGALIARNAALINAAASAKIFSPSKLKEEFNEIQKIYEAQIQEMDDKGAGASALDPTGAKAKAQADKAKAKADKKAKDEEIRLSKRTAKEIWDDENAANEKIIEELKATAKKEEEINIQKLEAEIETLKNSETELEISLSKNLITYSEYAKKVKDILTQIDDKDSQVKTHKIINLQEKVKTPNLTSEQKAVINKEISSAKAERLSNNLSYVQTMNGLNEGSYKNPNGGGGRKKDESYLNYKKQLLENEGAEFSRQINNQLKLNDEKYDDFLIGDEEYFKEKERLLNKSYEFELSLKNKEKQELENRKVSNESEKFEKLTEIVKIIGEINALEAEHKNIIKDTNRELSKAVEYKEKSKKITENELEQAKKLAELDVEETRTSAVSSLGLISNEQLLQTEQFLADQKYQIQKDLLEKNMALYAKGSDEYERYLNSLNLLDVDHAKGKQESAIAMQASQLEETMKMIRIYEDGFVDIAQSMVKGPEAVVEAFKKMGNAIMMELIAVEAKILARKVLSQLFGISLDGNQAQPGGVLGIANAGRSNNPTGLAQGLLGGLLGASNATTNNNGANTTNNNNVTQNINISGGLGGGSDKSTLSQIFNGIGGAIKGAFGSIG